jgi:hypothetical protein
VNVLGFEKISQKISDFLEEARLGWFSVPGTVGQVGEGLSAFGAASWGQITTRSRGMEFVREWPPRIDFRTVDWVTRP